MEIDKFKKWMDAAQQFQSDKFWNQILNENNENIPSLNSLTTIKELFPKCDLYETENELIIEAEIPGMAKEDLHITVNQQVLTITGEFKTLKQNCKYFLKERANRKFIKELTLPYPIFANKIRSEIRNGILVIFMPFYREDSEKIPINFNHTNPDKY
ncbi:Hsp20/alpha crystallin family protein [Neobacillus pocheonensis]|uniref:Hsp20/alpha crystallin family protein n=1 Tax=Neobacillus pocheonensis TaxID=363869 RepID=A0ABT0W6M4_9BACI|nr:Hsp20/alpha crystallin family protein [Neobacillus pocheonensis]